MKIFTFFNLKIYEIRSGGEYILTILTNPYLLMSFCVFLGMVFGNIRFGKFSFGTSGSMFVGIVVGWIITSTIKGMEVTDNLYNTGQSILAKGIIDKGYFDLFLILFIASVGLLAAKEVGRVVKKYGVKFIFLGFLITSVAALTTFGTNLLIPANNPYLYTGAFTGALTSSPGLAASIETVRTHSTELIENYDNLSLVEKQRIISIINDGIYFNNTDYNVNRLTKEQKESFIRNAEAAVGTGYAITYPFGVIIVIFAMHFFPVIFKIDKNKETVLLEEELKGNSNKEGNKIIKDNIKEVYFDLSAFALACIVGYFLGVLKIPLGSLGSLSLGSTGGVLIAALVLGHFGSIGPFCFRMNSKVLGVIRTITLAYFFAVIGIRYGYQVVNSLTGPGISLVIAGILIGSIPMLIGFFVGRYIFKINWVMLSGAICGGMTSTPGLGAAIDAIGSDDPAAGYGAVYPFALFGMVLFSILLNKYI